MCASAKQLVKTFISSPAGINLGMQKKRERVFAEETPTTTIYN